MKIRFSTLLILLIISLMPKMSNVTGISEPKIDNLLESEEFKPDWQQLNLNSPSARDLMPLVYDLNKKTVLFGVIMEMEVIIMHDTWVFDHETMNWTEMNPTNSPPDGDPNHGHKMVFDPITEQIIMHGQDRTWAYSYKNNTGQFKSGKRTKDYYQAMVYDKKQRSVNDRRSEYICISLY